MPRKRRQESLTGVYHWIVRGMNKKDLFHHAKDYERFKALLLEYKNTYQVLIYHYCLMTNHVHLLLHVPELKQLSKFSHYIQRRYAYYYCGKYKWTGSVFQRGYRSLAIDRNEYLLECGRYVERNPLRAKLVQDLEQYAYSGYRYYVYGRDDKLITSSPAYLGLSDDIKERCLIYAKYVRENRLQEEMMEKGLLLR